METSYIYKITFEETPHFYIGVRKHPEPENDAYKGAPVHFRKEIGKKIQNSRGWKIKCIDINTGEFKIFPSLSSARKYYSIGMNMIRKLYSGELSSYKGISVLLD